MDIEFKNVKYDSLINNLSMKLISDKINSIYDIDGNGKTIYDLLNGNINNYDGDILLGKKNIKKLKSSNDMCFLDINIDENMTVKSYMEDNLKKYNYKLDILDKHIADSIKMVGLNNNLISRKISELSSGEKMLVKIGSLLSLNPKVIVMYNPIEDLDAPSIKNLIKIIRILKNRFHKTFVFVTSNIEFMHKISDNIYLINNGSLIKYGDKYDIFTDFELLKEHNIILPNTILFSKKVLDKTGKKIGYRNDINDLLKDIYRYAR